MDTCFPLLKLSTTEQQERERSTEGERSPRRSERPLLARGGGGDKEKGERAVGSEDARGEPCQPARPGAQRLPVHTWVCDQGGGRKTLISE